MSATGFVPSMPVAREPEEYVMNAPARRNLPDASISAVERDTGLSKDTLRVWERRYGFPAPGRDPFGERVYPADQVEKLRAIRRLVDAGHRPGKIIALPLDALLALACADAPAPEATAPSPYCDVDAMMQLVRAQHHEELRLALSQAALRMGLDAFVAQLCAPLNRRVGEAWARGELEVFEEHLYTESMQVVLRNSISNIPARGHRPRVLLTTFPGEAHGLGLLMAEAVLALDGCRCVSLGTQTPVPDIVRAAGAQRSDIVAISFSPSPGANQVVDGLAQLRAALDPCVEVWAGGRHPALRRRAPRGVSVLLELSEIRPSLGRWRGERPQH